MKVKELIAMLEAEDQEANVYTSEGPIYFAESKPGFYDGPAPILLRDPNRKGYNIIGMKWDGKNEKVCLHIVNPDSILFDARSEEAMNKLIWDVSDVRNGAGILESIEEHKQEALKFLKEIEKK